MKEHFEDTKSTLSSGQYSTLTDWIARNSQATYYLWLAEMEDPSREIFAMCERMIARGADLQKTKTDSCDRVDQAQLVPDRHGRH